MSYPGRHFRPRIWHKETQSCKDIKLNPCHQRSVFSTVVYMLKWWANYWHTRVTCEVVASSEGSLIFHIGFSSLWTHSLSCADGEVLASSEADSDIKEKDATWLWSISHIQVIEVSKAISLYFLLCFIKLHTFLKRGLICHHGNGSMNMITILSQINATMSYLY